MNIHTYIYIYICVCVYLLVYVFVDFLLLPINSRIYLIFALYFHLSYICACGCDYMHVAVFAVL